MTDVEKQIKERLEQDESADLEGAQDLIEAHIDDVSGGGKEGGGFSLHVQTTNSPNR